MELGGWKSYEMVLRYAHLAPEKLGAVASLIERQPLWGPTGELRGRNESERCYVSAFVPSTKHLGESPKYLIDWRARRDSNSRPSGS
jgi:hypothetical protein